jgi:ubiquinol-cytochrome c reductase cytochrome c1 subunit
MKKLLFVLLLVLPLPALASEGGYRLDKSPHDPRDLVSLQAGARTFVNYCQGCHGAQYMRFNRLTDLGLTEAQIRDHLLFTADKVGETMKTAMGSKEAKAWFGVAPPDLSVIARSRGADWLYTYLRTFYRDPKSATGWNNAVFPNVSMPHALWALQGERSLEAPLVKDLAGHERVQYKWSQMTPGTLGQVEYDALTRDLVNFLVYVGEPAASSRRSIGIVVLFVLGIVFIFAWLLKREYWKDVK